MSIASRLKVVRDRIRQAEAQFGRKPNSIQLLAVSKTQPIEAIQAAYEAGQRCFGENQAQEAEKKIKKLGGLDIDWHFIGPIQANKTKLIAEHFHWVHSLSREKIAIRLNEQRPRDLSRLNLCIQVNISQKSSKSGITIAELPKLLLLVSRLPRLNLRGLMLIPEECDEFSQQRAAFHQLKELFETMKQAYKMDTLSIGMSNDLEAAIAEGATIVRVGTDIFGKRNRV